MTERPGCGCIICRLPLPIPIFRSRAENQALQAEYEAERQQWRESNPDLSKDDIAAREEG